MDSDDLLMEVQQTTTMASVSDCLLVPIASENRPYETFCYVVNGALIKKM